ncbi:MAG: hypothetical protein KDI75_02885 [Xanthomonadales bacterium]|nr:hypothetical protein [Xanthomonadales bacterium]
MNIAIHEISADTFANLGDGTIDIARADGSRLSLRLHGVSPLGAHGPRPVPPFSAILIAPDGTQLAQGVYALEHPTLGQLELFLVPIAPKDGQPAYEIVFN